MKWRFGSLAALIVGVGFVACAPADGGAGGEGADTVAMNGGAAGEAGGVAGAGGADTMRTPAQEGMGGREEVQLQALNNSGVTGEAYLTPIEDSTTVAVTLEPSGGEAGGQVHPAHIHTGTCPDLGNVVAPLDSIVSDPELGPTSTTVVNIPLDSMMDGQHLIAVHDSAGQPVACATLAAGGGM